MFISETKRRTLYKSISWRAVAIINSWAILSIINDPCSNFMKALVMNITGFVAFYGFERIWSKIKYGRSIIKEKNEL
jgi:uncharacterized membrane protein